MKRKVLNNMCVVFVLFHTLSRKAHRIFSIPCYITIGYRTKKHVMNFSTNLSGILKL